MAVLIKEKQIDMIRSAYVGITGVAFPAAASIDITTPLSTVLATASDAGTPVPMQVSPDRFTQGLVVAEPKNYVQVIDSLTKKPLGDPLNEDNEVYGRITEAVGVYTISLYTLIAGVETIYTPAAAVTVDVYPLYRFTADNYPTDAIASIPTTMLFNDPTRVITKQQNFTELLTVIALNTLSDLTQLPDVPANIILEINGQAVDSFGGIVAPFAVTVQTIVWSPANAGFNIEAGDRVVALYTYII
jgi:hypothetical protein